MRTTFWLRIIRKVEQKIEKTSILDQQKAIKVVKIWKKNEDLGKGYSDSNSIY